MFTQSTKYYDRICGEFKDYRAEAELINTWIKKRLPEAKTILDFACGSAEHARILTEDYGYAVDGVDLEQGFIDLARGKCPTGNFALGDMIDFEMGRKYDVVLCLFSAIGYVKTVENTTKALSNFAKHLNPGGLMIVEPWITPDIFEHGKYYLRTVDDEDLKVARMSYSEVDGDISRITFEYLIAADGQFMRESEVHELVLLTKEKMSQCFSDAELNFRYDEVGLTNRGLYFAQN